MANFQIHELTSGTIDRDSNVIHDTLNGLDYETRKATAGAVADLNNIQVANEYDDTSTYSYGDYTIKNGVLYRNIVAITSPEAWTSAHWTAVMVTGEYKRVRIMTKAQYDLLSNDEKDGFIYVSDYPTKIQDIDNVNLTTSDNNKLLGVSVSGSDISVGAVEMTAADIPYTSGVSVADKIDDMTTYSTSEKVVGKWIDGSALYEQTIEVNNPTSTTVTDYDYFSIAELNVNADIGYFVNGYAIRSDGRRLSLPYNRFYSAGNIIIPEVYIDYATGKISVSITKLSSWNVTINKVVITVRYTKKS